MNNSTQHFQVDWPAALREFKIRCHKCGFRITPQRVAIYKEIMMTSQHPSATEIYAKVRSVYPNISLGTVNSSLLAFAGKTIIRIVGATGDPKRFEGNFDPHYHFRCIKCHKIIDIKGNVCRNIEIPKEIKGKYLIMDKYLVLEGKCDTCR